MNMNTASIHISSKRYSFFYPKRVHKPTGLSLAELLISIFILTLILLPIFFLFSQSSNVIKITQHEADAISIGTSFTSQIRKIHPSMIPETGIDISIASSMLNGYFNLGGLGQNQITIPSFDTNIFEITYKVISFPITTKLNKLLGKIPKLVTLTISWVEPMGGVKMAKFQALLTGSD